MGVGPRGWRMGTEQSSVSRLVGRTRGPEGYAFIRSSCLLPGLQRDWLVKKKKKHTCEVETIWSWVLTIRFDCG